MNNVIGISVIVTNLALIGVVGYGIWKLDKAADRVVNMLKATKADAKRRVSDILKGLADV